MCGISIAIDTTNQAMPHDQIKMMNDKVSHRGPDDEGFYFGDRFAFGHRRLSIIDLSQAGHQPMQRDHLTITYNGEVYNYVELRNELIVLGHSFKSASDTEVILAAYQQWGVDAFLKFNGMWAFALHDARRNEIIFCRDHFGIKPLYYTQTNSYFLAGSEIKQLLAVDEVTPILNKKVAVNFLVQGSLNYSEETFFEEVYELRAGHCLRYNLTSHQFQIQQWYNLAEACVPQTDSYEKAVEKVRGLLVDSVRLRMRSDVRVGSCLSGGIDSSSIVSLIHSQSLTNADFATITSCYTDTRYDEQKFSDLVSQQTSYRSEKVYPQLNHLLDDGQFDQMIYHQDQPFSTASHYSEYCVFREARQNNMIVMQDGQGSDEFLCGYGEFYTVYVRELIGSFQWIKAFRLVKEKALHHKSSWFRECKSVLRSAYGYPFLALMKKVIGKKEYSWLSTNYQKIAQTEMRKFEQASIRELSITEIMYSSLPYQLHSEDRNSMLFSIESRLPFLDHRLVEYCIGLPSDYKIRNGFTKAVLRDAVYELPEEIRKRKDKMGFVAPDPIWMAQNKQRVREDLAAIVQSTGIFSNELLTRFDRFINGELAYEPIYFRAMALHRFCRIFKFKITA